MTVRGDFQEPARARPDLVIGREELFARAREQLSGGGSVLVHGPAGIGKSTVLRALAAECAESARTVLRCSSTETESHLPFLALADLLGLVVDEIADRLPPPQRTALESALTGRGESTLQRDGLALRLAVLSAFRALAARGPVLIVADDLQWLDPASAELLGFAARRTSAACPSACSAPSVRTPSRRPRSTTAIYARPRRRPWPSGSPRCRAPM